MCSLILFETPNILPVKQVPIVPKTQIAGLPKITVLCFLQAFGFVKVKSNQFHVCIFIMVQFSPYLNGKYNLLQTLNRGFSD